MGRKNSEGSERKVKDNSIDIVYQKVLEDLKQILYGAGNRGKVPGEEERGMGVPVILMLQVAGLVWLHTSGNWEEQDSTYP